jgi:hypothetical protein
VSAGRPLPSSPPLPGFTESATVRNGKLDEFVNAYPLVATIENRPGYATVEVRAADSRVVICRRDSSVRRNVLAYVPMPRRQLPQLIEVLAKLLAEDDAAHVTISEPDESAGPR